VAARTGEQIKAENTVQFKASPALKQTVSPPSADGAARALGCGLGSSRG